MSAEIQLLSVYRGEPQFLGAWKGRPVRSSIAKSPVRDSTAELDWLGLEGNEQADLRVHGGIRKAVYVYPFEHYAYWERELGMALKSAFFGENLLVAGVLEDDVRIGNQWQWGEALLEVTTPRQPCYKLIMHTGVNDIIQQMRANRRTGWYLKVLRPGVVPTSGRIEVVRQGEGETILANYAKKARGPLSPDLLG